MWRAVPNRERIAIAPGVGKHISVGGFSTQCLAVGCPRHASANAGWERSGYRSRPLRRLTLRPSEAVIERLSGVLVHVCADQNHLLHHVAPGSVRFARVFPGLLASAPGTSAHHVPPGSMRAIVPAW